MRILADENIGLPIVAHLRAEGHIVEYVHEIAGGSDDDVVLALANTTGQILLTDDKDFGELVFRRRLPSTGVILARLASLPNEQKGEVIARVLREHEPELANAFTVISPRAVRIRRQPT